MHASLCVCMCVCVVWVILWLVALLLFLPVMLEWHPLGCERQPDSVSNLNWDVFDSLVALWLW